MTESISRFSIRPREFAKETKGKIDSPDFFVSLDDAQGKRNGETNERRERKKGEKRERKRPVRSTYS